MIKNNIQPNKSLIVTAGDNNIYDKLVESKAFKNISNILNYYNIGNFNYVINNLNINDYVTFSKQLLSLKSTNQSNINNNSYNSIRNFISITLQGLLQCVYQSILLKQLQYKIDSNANNLDLLNDRVKLSKYLAEMNKLTSIFPNQAVNTIGVTLKPIYSEYIKLFGFPKDGIFNTDKLASITIIN